MMEALIPAGLSFLTGMFNRSQQSEFNQQQMAMAQQNIQLQKDFAQHGISWKADDARAAGLSPLAALGAQTASFSPVSLGGEAPKMDFGNMGQDVSRAFKAAMGYQDREEADAATARKLQIEKGALENDLLRQELVSRRARSVGQTDQLGPPVNSLDRVPIPRPGPARSNGWALEEDRMKIKEGSNPGVKTMNLWGAIPLKMDPNRASGQDLQNEYGDLAGDALAAPNVLSDINYTLSKRYPNWMGSPYGWASTAYKRFKNWGGRSPTWGRGGTAP